MIEAGTHRQTTLITLNEFNNIKYHDYLLMNSKYNNNLVIYKVINVAIDFETRYTNYLTIVNINNDLVIKLLFSYTKDLEIKVAKNIKMLKYLYQKC
jgi:hypothetical protein